MSEKKSTLSMKETLMIGFIRLLILFITIACLPVTHASCQTRATTTPLTTEQSTVKKTTPAIENDDDEEDEEDEDDEINLTRWQKIKRRTGDLAFAAKLGYRSKFLPWWKRGGKKIVAGSTAAVIAAVLIAIAARQHAQKKAATGTTSSPKP